MLFSSEFALAKHVFCQGKLARGVPESETRWKRNKMTGRSIYRQMEGIPGDLRCLASNKQPFFTIPSPATLTHGGGAQFQKSRSVLLYSRVWKAEKVNP
jgi:hypothetical protein